MEQALQRLLLLASLLLCFFACYQVSGLELRLRKLVNRGATLSSRIGGFAEPCLSKGNQQEDEIADPSSSPVDKNNLYSTEDGRLIELFPEPDSHFRLSNSTRRKLGDFLGCAFCKCCDEAKTFCKTGLPCCYSINCNVEPFGFCKFVPIACNCNGCGL